MTNSHRYTVTVSPSPVSPVFTVHRHRFHQSSPFTGHRFHRSSPIAITSEHLTIRGEKLSLRYQLPGNGVTEVSAICFLTKDFQYSLFEGSPRSSLVHRNRSVPLNFDDFLATGFRSRFRRTSSDKFP